MFGMVTECPYVSFIRRIGRCSYSMAKDLDSGLLDKIFTKLDQKRVVLKNEEPAQGGLGDGVGNKKPTIEVGFYF